MRRLLLGCGSIVLLLLFSSPFAHLATGQTVLQAIGGNANHPDGPPGTGYIFIWRAEQDQPGPFRFALRGPQGWNRDRPREWQAGRGTRGSYWDAHVLQEIPAVAGTYKLTGQIDGREVTTEFSITLSPQLPRPSVRITEARRDRIALEWTEIPGALSYDIDIRDQRGSRVARRVVRGTTSAAFAEQVLFPGEYRVLMGAISLDLTQTPTTLSGSFNSSWGITTFTIP